MYVEIEFIHSINGADSASSFVSLHWLDLGPPEWIYGHPVLKESSNPGEVILLALLDAWMYRIVHENNPDLVFSNQFVHFVPTIAHNLCAVCIDHYGLRVIQDFLVFRPTGMNDGVYLNFRLCVEMLGKQVRTGLKLMVSGSMASGSIKKNDL